MANKFKNNKTGGEKNSLFKGNWAIDTTASNIGGGPSSVTELYNGAPIPPGGYTMYSPEGVYATAIESDLLAKVKDLGGDYSSISAALTWAASEPGVIILNKAFDNIVTDGLVLNVDASNISSFTDSEPTVNLYGDINTSAAIRPSRTEYNTDNWTAGFPKPPENIGRVYHHTSGALSSTWSGNSYGYTLKSYTYLANVTYTLSCWVYVSSDCNIGGLPNSMEGTTLIDTSKRYYDLNNKGTWQQIVLKCKSASNVNGNVIPVYPSRSGITDGSFSGFYAWGGAKLEALDHVTPYTVGTRAQNTGLYDLSNSDNHGVLANGPTFDSNGNIDFDGIDDYIDIGSHSSLTLNAGGSITALCKWDSYNGSSWSNTIIGKGSGSWANHHYILFKASGTNKILFSVSNGSSYLNGSGPYTRDIPLNQWFYVTATWDNTVKKIYYNGNLESSVNSSIMPISSAAPVSIGRTGSAAYYLDGKISQVQLYNKDLSSIEILQNYYQAPIVTDGLVLAVDAGNLVSYENGSATAYNLAGSEMGTLTNGVGFDSNNSGTWTFDGIDDYINMGTGLLNLQNASFSLEACIKWDGGSEDTFFGYVYTGAPNQNIHWRIYPNGQLRFDFYSNSINSAVGSIVVNEWTHLLVTYDYTTDTCICYKNGSILMQGSAGPFTGIDASSTAYLGSWGSNAQYYGGDLSTFKAYNKALTADEVTQNFSAQRNRFGI